MPSRPLPDWARLRWEGGTVFVHLPEVVETDSHRLEPVLTRADASSIAEAIAGTVASRRQYSDLSGGDARFDRVVLVRDRAFSAEGAERFLEKLRVALREKDLQPRVEVLGEAPSAPAGFDPGAETDHTPIEHEALSGPSAPTSRPPVPPPSPTAPPPSEPPPASSPSRPSAPVPSRRRLDRKGDKKPFEVE